MNSRRFLFPQLFVILIASLAVRVLHYKNPSAIDSLLNFPSCTTQQQDLIGNTSEVLSVAFSPDGRYALTGSNDWTARLWEVSTGRLVRTFTGHTGGVTSVAFSPDGTEALTASMDRTARLWDIQSGVEI